MGVPTLEGAAADARDDAEPCGEDAVGNLSSGVALMTAVQSRHVELVARLLEQKSHPDKANKDGVTPLHMAVFDGVYDIVQMLLVARADVDSRDRYGQTPLFFAPHQAVCTQLGLASADANVFNKSGQSPLHTAAHAGLNDVVAWLVDHMKPSNINARDKHGRTAVFCAAHSNLVPTVILLQENGADITLRPHRYSSAKGKRSGGACASAGGSPTAAADLSQKPAEAVLEAPAHPLPAPEPAMEVSAFASAPAPAPAPGATEVAAEAAMTKVVAAVAAAEPSGCATEDAREDATNAPTEDDAARVVKTAVPSILQETFARMSRGDDAVSAASIVEELDRCSEDGRARRVAAAAAAAANTATPRLSPSHVEDVSQVQNKHTCDDGDVVVTGGSVAANAQIVAAPVANVIAEKGEEDLAQAEERGKAEAEADQKSTVNAEMLLRAEDREKERKSEDIESQNDAVEEEVNVAPPPKEESTTESPEKDSTNKAEIDGAVDHVAAGAVTAAVPEHAAPAVCRSAETTVKTKHVRPLEREGYDAFLADVSTKGGAKALESAPSSFRADREIVLTAVANDEAALRLAAPELASDESFLAAAGLVPVFAQFGEALAPDVLTEVLQELDPDAWTDETIAELFAGRKAGEPIRVAEFLAWLSSMAAG
eukprot:TRINITY_DN18373_c0_g1_i1.p1 TRINITY_DN18373_c0_g1~~TRINITY_DN18373_c0_g1_i1.p1  ORF type:complete len:657 (-),score=142.78 TRINITY_DN18373_c0_g1_i1:113-2083(-)